MTEADEELIQSEADEQIMKSTLLKCYGSKALGFRVSAEHYRYLAEQVVALREHIKRSIAEENEVCAKALDAAADRHADAKSEQPPEEEWHLHDAAEDALRNAAAAIRARLKATSAGCS